jgi:IS4 transposase
VRKQWNKIHGSTYQTKTIDVELNLAEKPSDPDQWRTVRRQFVRGCDDKPCSGKHDWALFLSTDTTLSPQQMLEIYALRWGIEVYFKECKQNLGLLKEQTISFSSHIASITLSALLNVALCCAGAGYAAL